MKEPIRPESRSYLRVDEYESRAFAVCEFFRLIILDITRHDLNNRQLVLRNALARTCVTLRSVFTLYQLKDYQGCWIFNRCLLDRLLTIYHIVDRDTFDEFEAWSFMKQYNLRNRVRSHQEFRDRLDLEFFRDPEHQKERYRRLSASPPSWSRPNMESVAKSRKLSFLYSLGYEYGSMMVHPMADDGQQDFYLVTGLTPPQPRVDQRVVLHDSIAVGAMIGNEVMAEVGFVWRRPATEFLHDLTGGLLSGDQKYQVTLERVKVFSIIGQPKADETEA